MLYADARRPEAISAAAYSSEIPLQTRTLGFDDLAAIAHYLRAETRTIFGVTMLVLAVVLFGWALWPAKYHATALVTLDPRPSKLLPDDNGNQEGTDSDGSAIVSLAELSTSDGALIPLMRELNLLDDPEYQDGSNGSSTAAAAQLRRNLKVTRRGLTYVLDVSATSKDAEKAARIANAVASDIVSRQRAARQASSGGVAEALQSRLADLRAAALASERKVADYRQRSSIPDVPLDARMSERRLASLAEQIGPMRQRLEDARARYDLVRTTRNLEPNDPGLLQSDLLTNLLRRLSDEKRELATTLRVYGPLHPIANAARASVSDIEDQIRSERTRIVAKSKSELNALTIEIDGYESEIAKRTQEQLNTDQKTVVLNDLIGQADADRQLYETSLKRQKSAQEQADLAQPEAVVVSRAEPPTRSSRLSLILIAPIGLLSGLALAVAWTLYRVRRDPRAVVAGMGRLNPV